MVPTALSLAPHDGPDPDGLSPLGALAVLAPNAAAHARQMEPATIARTTERHGPAIPAAVLGLAPPRGCTAETCPTLARLAGRGAR